MNAGTGMCVHIPLRLNPSFVGMARETAAMPPADLVHIRNIQRPNRSFSSVQMFHTHTHPAGAGSTLKGKRKKKADTNDGQKAKTAQGGKGTNGPPEPTYTARRT